MFINLGTILVFIKYSTMLFGQSEPGQNVVKVDNCKKASILVLGVLCFIGGIFGEELISFLFNVSANVDAAGYLEKTFFFLISGFAGFLIYHKYYLKNSKLLAKFGHIEMGFRSMCTLMGVFFAVLLIVTHLTVY